MAPSLPALRRRADEQITAQLTATVDELSEALAAEGANSDFLMERLADLELALDDAGWTRLSFETEWEFSRDGIDRIVALSRLASIKNPLIVRGVRLKADYVFGQGVEIAARDDQINELVIQPFLDDPANAKVLFSDTSLPEKDQALTTDGNLVLNLFPNQYTGHVSVRSIDVGEIRDIITNPEDRAEVWFYLRRWIERRWALDGPAAGTTTVQREAWYPDWRHRPPAGQRPESINRVIVRWDAPIYHATIGGLDGMRFGLPEVYAALDWAKAYKLFLEDWATIVRSLSRFAWAATVKKNPAAAARKLGSTITPSAPREGVPSPVAGSAFVASESTTLSPMAGKSDATVASEDGVWLAKMVAAALGLPYPILMGDPDMGNLATAKTLDRPTELGMIRRQRVWAEIIRDLCSYAIDWAIRAPGGPLPGREEKGPDGRLRMVVDDIPASGDDEAVTGADRRTVDVIFPDILEQDIEPLIKAIVLADSTELPPPEVTLRLLLTAFGIEDIDEILAGLDERLEQRQAQAGQLAIDRVRRGEDPAEPFGDATDDEP